MKKTTDMTFSEMATELDKLRAVTPAPTGPREVIVIDRGWIFAGDVKEESNGSLTLTNAIHLVRWESIGFARALTEWKTNKVFLQGIQQVVKVPANSVIMRLSVEDGWGVK